MNDSALSSTVACPVCGHAKAETMPTDARVWFHEFSEVHVGQTRGDQVELPLVAEGVLRYVWDSRFGAMLVEVNEGRAYVNGPAVESADPSTQP